MSPRCGAVGVHLRSVAHTLSLTVQGRHEVREICRGRERRWTERAGAVTFLGRDGDDHDFLATPASETLSLVFLIPAAHLHAIASAEGITVADEPMRVVSSEDGILQACLRSLGAAATGGEERQEGRGDEAARRIILRLHELSGGTPPDWHRDESVFDSRTLDQLVAHIDAHLNTEPCLVDMGLRVGLSPSHFARKFRNSTGLSLHRFVNRRRIGASLTALKDRSQPLAHVALDLGFSSQSHFTRLFSDLTGMTPAKYRKQFRPTPG